MTHHLIPFLALKLFLAPIDVTEPVGDDPLVESELEKADELDAMAAAAVNCPEGYICLSEEDRQELMPILVHQQCMLANQPKISVDPITIVTDNKGRVFASGSGAMPFTLHIDWCELDIVAEGSVDVIAAKTVAPTWGFRFRLKSAIGVMPTEAFRKGNKFHEGLDGGLMLDPFFWNMLNVNVYAGVRSFGAGIGVDVTDNFGVAGLAVVTWDSWRPAPLIVGYFAF